MKRRFKYIFVVVILVLVIFLWWQVFYLEREELKFYLLDVGQGDAIFIETPSGNQVLIDGGPGRKVLAELGGVMPFWDRSLDLVILTHPHLDHVAGLVDVLINYQVGVFIDAGDKYNLAEYQEIKKLVETKKLPYWEARRGIKIILDKNTELSILAPEKLVASKNPHDNAVISKLSFGQIDFLLMADAEKGEELRLVTNGDEIQSEVLKVGHHGSKTSSNPLFLEKVGPQYVLISVGAKNPYGHPHPEVLDNLSKIGAKIFRTDLDSRIELESDGENLTVRTSK